MIRLGTTSYIIPDAIIPNVRFLSGKVQDVELVLFESKEASNLPTAQEIQTLALLARQGDLTYTVHFPLDVWPGAADETLRRTAVETYLRIIRLTDPLPVFSYVLHLTPEAWGAVPSTDMDRWLSQLDRSLQELTGESEVDPSRFCAETLSYPFSLVLPLVRRHHLSVTLDIGHIWLMGYDAGRAARQLLPAARIIHIHGVRDGKDHRSLADGDPRLVDAFLSQVVRQEAQDGVDRVVTIEVFGQEKFFSSKPLLEKPLRRILAPTRHAHGDD
jgi:sugar phosphate isomerase/epimerase